MPQFHHQAVIVFQIKSGKIPGEILSEKFNPIFYFIQFFQSEIFEVKKLVMNDKLTFPKTSRTYFFQVAQVLHWEIGMGQSEF